MQVSQLRLGLLRLLCGLEEESELVLGLATRVWLGCLTWSSAFRALGLSSLALSALPEAASLAGLVSEACSHGVSWFMPSQNRMEIVVYLTEILGGKMGIVLVHGNKYDEGGVNITRWYDSITCLSNSRDTPTIIVHLNCSQNNLVNTC